MMTLVCFDLDDTLVASHKAHVVAFNEAFAANGMPEVKEARIRPYFGLAGKTIVQGVFPSISPKFAAMLSDEHTRLLVEKHINKIKAVKGVRRMLAVLKRRGYRLALLSNSRKRLVLPVLRAAGIRWRVFDIIIGRDEVKKPKPHPDEILLAMRKLKEKDACMVGDTVFDMAAGKLAGIKTVAVLTGYQKRKALKRQKPDYILRSAAELPNILT